MVAKLVTKTHIGKLANSFLSGFFSTDAPQVECNENILQCSKTREQIIFLKDETNMLQPELAFSVADTLVIGEPPIVISPDVGLKIPPMMESRVVLPLPEGPISMTISPLETVRLTSFSAWCTSVPVVKDLEMEVAVRTCCINIFLFAGKPVLTCP